MYVPIDQEMRP